MNIPLERFTDGAATALLEGVRWPEGARCPRCEAANPARITTRSVYRCRSCRFEFSVTTGTVFQKHKLSHESIVRTILWEEQNEGRGSTTELADVLGVTFKTAHVLRLRMFEAKLGTWPFGERSVLARGYWQGFNRFFVSADGQLARKNRRGQVRAA